mmetsp:Transcript_31207/g.107294  ORF Transcript_31207/g.107294 Transcript_31207/m.107294 type:complete len:598 (+) Transcript_31207:2-1795(+)
MLVDEGQAHLFEAWAVGGDFEGFFQQIKNLDASYPGGLKAYLASARGLLVASAKGENPLSGWVPSVPTGERLDFGSDAWNDFEAAGLVEAKDCCFVLVAGGLGERLGYSRIKVELPTETCTKVSYLRYYIEWILALEKRSGATTPSPLAIMVSGDTEAMTMDLLQANGDFGARPGQITLMKQEFVAALSDNNATMAADGPYAVQAKPHGHGDVHVLLHQRGLVKQWAAEKRKWVYFFQDTNALGFRPLLPMLGISAKHGMHVNFLTVPRLPGQAVGGITKLDNIKTGESMTLNVEYNQLDPLLRATVSPDGDVAGEDGLSPYPGNINQFVLACAPYAATLARTSGVMGEFVNPKYTDAKKMQFKKPARLECMMQDYPKVLAKGEVVGFTSTDSWIAFSPCKNASADAAKQSPPASALSAEADQYHHCAEMLRRAGVKCETSASEETWQGLSSAKMKPEVVLSPSFAVSFGELKKRFPLPQLVSVSAESTLVLKGDITVKSLSLAGGLFVEAQPGAKVTISECVVSNGGFTRGAVGADAPEALRIRGYDTVKAPDAAVFKLARGNWLITTDVATGKPVVQPDGGPPREHSGCLGWWIF